jgi:hypothetical protein
MLSIEERYYTVGIYRISCLCQQSYPCKHYVIKNNYDNGSTMLGHDIYKMLKKEGLSHSHFDEYKKLVEQEG